MPLVRKVCERSLRVEDATLPLIAHLLGPVCHTLHHNLDAAHKQWFIEFYCKLAVLGLPADSRKNEAPVSVRGGCGGVCLASWVFRGAVR